MIGRVGIKEAYDEFNPVIAFGGDIGSYVFASLVAFRNVGFHDDDDDDDDDGCYLDCVTAEDLQVVTLALSTSLIEIYREKEKNTCTR